ncbi:hypothetical protein PoB_006750000 [Plakobranchus ocellatus]|uniref:Uncharacterized protein n=1 Tax=Plakobranchus ocellatus TaxID=259542 RepID=A0AAV4DAL8_9GAST|nr:hypothetical protein PoB_006750000 [Plakobranchus ocellatus]
MTYTVIKVRAPDVHLIVLRQLPVQLDSGIYVLYTATETPCSTITLLAAYCHHSTTTPHRTIALTRETMKYTKEKISSQCEKNDDDDDQEEEKKEEENDKEEEEKEEEKEEEEEEEVMAVEEKEEEKVVVEKKV